MTDDQRPDEGRDAAGSIVLAAAERGRSGADAPGGSPWRGGGPNGVDRAVAVVVAVGLPLAAAWLFERTGGALASLVLYYGVASVGLSLWRRGTLGFRRPVAWPWSIFLPSLVLPLVLGALDVGQPAPPPTAGFWLTLLVWAPLNGAVEHLVWFYAFDAWRDGWRDRRGAVTGLAVGVLLMLGLVGAIHAVFWARFLPAGAGGPALAATLNAVVLLAYVLLRDRSGSQWPVFALHALVDLQLVLLARYSILPDL